MSAPILFLGWGNPSRGDDALGPLLCERLAQLLTRSDLAAIAARTEVQQDFQLQVEDASDIAGRELVVFIDASVAADAPFSFTPVAPLADASVTTHALSPAAVVDVACKIFGATPLCYQMAVRGEVFELGEGLSAAAALHLEAAWRALREIALAEDAPAAAADLAAITGRATGSTA
ncbi:MAG TPA: hydrogenase maturation protease [Rhodocyclaceae bacterium]|nr:hydrogenase maturation protease [Rhodocyclaceae bacterium]